MINCTNIGKSSMKSATK